MISHNKITKYISAAKQSAITSLAKLSRAASDRLPPSPRMSDTTKWLLSLMSCKCDRPFITTPTRLVSTTKSPYRKYSQTHLKLPCNRSSGLTIESTMTHHSTFQNIPEWRSQKSSVMECKPNWNPRKNTSHKAAAVANTTNIIFHWPKPNSR